MVGSKINQAANAIGQFLGLLEIDDEIGIASYNHEATTNFAMTTVSSPAVLQVAANSLNGLEIISLTSIGAGMIEGQTLLSATAASNPPKGMLLLSDGIENFSPHVADAYSAIPISTDIYTIGFGDDCDQELMNDIANNTNGLYYYGTGADLSAICEEIITQMRGRDLILKEAGEINTNNDFMNHKYQIEVDDSKQVVFTLLWANEDSKLDFDLFDPTGKLITSEQYLNEGLLEIVENNTQKFFRIKNPIQGIWTARLKCTYLNPLLKTEPYYFHVSTYSDLNLLTYLDKSKYQVGESIQLSAKLTDSGNPVENAVVSAELYSFDNSLEVVTLFDDGNHNDEDADDGIYGNISSPVSTPETCTIIFKAQSSADSQQQFTRVVTHSTYIVPDFAEPCTPIHEVYVDNQASKEYVPDIQVFNVSNSPNPFNPNTTIYFSITESAQTKLTVFNVRGQEVVTLINDHLAAGSHQIYWDGEDHDHNAVSSGIYYFRIDSKNSVISKKIILMK